MPTTMVRLSLALSLICSSEPPNSGFSFLCGELQFIGVASETLDTRELRYTFANPADFDVDLTNLRKRFIDLQYAPFLADACLFPYNRDAIGEMLLFNRRYKNHLVQMQALYPSSTSISEAIQETDKLYHVWDNLRDSLTSYYTVNIRRVALDSLRKSIGGEAFQRGEMPDFVPRWRMAEIK